MKKSTKIAALALGAFLLAAPLASCSGQGGSSTTSQSSSSSSSSSSTSTPVVDKWTAAQENVMKQHLDGYVLPFIEEGTVEWDSEYECVSFNSKAKTTQSKIDSYATKLAGEGFSCEKDVDDDHVCRKVLPSGKVVIVSMYIGTGDIFWLDAYLTDAPALDWDSDQIAAIESVTEEGFELPYLPLAGDWYAISQEGYLYVGSNKIVSTKDLERYVALLEVDGYSMDVDDYGDPLGTKVLDSGATVTVNCYIGYSYGLVVDISYTKAVTEWPAEEIKQFLGDKVTTVVPAFTWDSYLLPASSSSFNIQMIDEVEEGTKTAEQCIAETVDVYKATLEGANWLIDDSYYSSIGVYLALDINESVMVQFSWSSGVFAISFRNYVNPYLVVADWAGVQLRAESALAAGSPELPDLSSFGSTKACYQDATENTFEIRLSNETAFDLSAVNDAFTSAGYELDDSKLAEAGYMIANKATADAALEVMYYVYDDVPAGWPHYLYLSCYNVSAPGDFDWITGSELVSNSATAVVWKSGKATITLGQGESSTPANNYVGGLAGRTETRAYAKNTITVAVEEGYKINSITLKTKSLTTMPDKMPTTIAGCTVTFDSANKSIVITANEQLSSISFTLGGTSGNIAFVGAHVSYSAI